MKIPTAKDLQQQIRRAKAQVFFCGGHGGVVTYDGKGGPMVKDGGPIDRLFVLRNEGELGGDHGLDITYGTISFRTGRLARDVRVSRGPGGTRSVVFAFEGNEDTRAVEIRGGIAELDVPYNTVLFRGTVDPSEMRLVIDAQGRVTLPYTALHHSFKLDQRIAKRFGVRVSPRSVAVSAWCKKPPDEEEMAQLRQVPAKGPAFKTQQHLGSLRLYVV